MKELNGDASGLKKNYYALCRSKSIMFKGNEKHLTIFMNSQPMSGHCFLWHHPFITYGKFSEKLIFVTHVRVRIMG